MSFCAFSEVYYPASGLCHLYEAVECVDLIHTQAAVRVRE